MRRRNVMFLLLAAAISHPAAAQVSVSAPNWNGMEVHLVARIQPGSAEVPAGVLSDRGRFHRIVSDRIQRRYFGYDLLVEPKDGSQVFQVRIEPLSWTATELAERRLIDSSAWTPVPLLKYPVIPDVRPGDTVAIDLLENPTTGQKVVDYLTFKRAGPPAAAELSPLQDLSLAQVELQLENARISLNGEVLEASRRFGGGVSGPALWFYLPERGRFVLSMLPNPQLGFRRAGEVSGNALTFAVGSDQYRVQSSGRIVPATGRFHLYVLHDPKWRPVESQSSAPLIMGAADRAEWLAAK